MKKKFALKMFHSNGAVLVHYLDVDNITDAFARALESYYKEATLELVDVYEITRYPYKTVKKLLATIHDPK